MTTPRDRQPPRPRVQAEAAYTIAEAAAIKSVSPDFVRQAIKRTEPPRLDAKLVGRSYHVSASALEAWWAQFPDV